MALWSGFILGMTRLVTEYLTKEGIIELTPGSLLQVMLDINFLHYAIYLFIFSVAVLMLFSQLGRPKSDDLLQLVTFNKKEMKLKFAWTSDVWLTLLLIGCVLALWIIFSPLGLA